MELLQCWTLFILSGTFASVFQHVTALASDIEIVYPERLESHRYRRDLSTSKQHGHDDKATFLLGDSKKNLVIDINKNKQLISPNFALRYFKEDGSEVISKVAPENCHYQGSLRGKPDSRVVLETCNGLRGLIDDGDKTFYIEPHENYKVSGAHKLYPSRGDEFDDESCGNADEPVHESFKAHAHKKRSRFRRSPAIIENINPVYMPFLTTMEVRYNEMCMVVDNMVYQRYDNNTEKVMERMVTLVNVVDNMYRAFNIRIVLTCLEIWTNGDRMVRSVDASPELSTFKNYRNEDLLPRINHDNAQFISHTGWPGIAGMAYLNGICRGYSAGINAWSFSAILGPYVVLAHEMGHNFNFKHDTAGTCNCLVDSGCFMGGPKTPLCGVSNCSMESLKNINDECLYNVPIQAYNQVCGNGIREGNETCDCGTPEMCNTHDPCCKPFDCQLKRSCQCSDLHHACCTNCTFAKQGTLCRPVMNDCDLPEYCTGDSLDCPADVYMQDGISCDTAKKLFLGNTDRWRVVRQTLPYRIQARYVRINPQHWKDQICMRTEFYGCSSNEVPATEPTPVKAYNDYCVATEQMSCAISGTDYPMFKPGYKCDKDYMQFRLDANDILRHHCSNTSVCPENGATSSGTRLVISDSCKDEDSKFERTSGKSLKHIKSGKCVHPSGGWPGKNKTFVIWGGCDQDRLQWWFMKQDCILPLGMRDGAIPDSSVTASSYRAHNELPHYARLNTGKYWCAKTPNKNEYLEVDLGEETSIAAIDIQGRGTWYNWVTGFYLFYSQDGQHWTGYSDSGNVETADSLCRKGKCVITHETQCKNLWGATGKDAVQGCYDKLNTERTGYGTCDPVANTVCAAENVRCGQIQCYSPGDTPASYPDYGLNYTKITLDSGDKCSAAVLNEGDSMGLGMISEGSRCGDDKMCVDYQCKGFSDLGIVPCPKVNNQTCAGNGVCDMDNRCYCNIGYDPSTNCQTSLAPVNGGYSEWSTWNTCDRLCDGGRRSRHRFCNNPVTQHGGQDCTGDRIQVETCNTDACPAARSCRHLQSIGQELGLVYPDGVYRIYPHGMTSSPVMAYCDMTRDGGGWTLLVSSHTNSWTAENVKLRNPEQPTLLGDYSILEHGDAIKDNFNVSGLQFEYRLDAQNPDHWGAIFKAERSYTLTSTTNEQTNVELVTKFDDWEIGDRSIEARVPWISGARLTTSASATSNWWGTITGDVVAEYYPAPWLSGELMPDKPSHIWYWIREGPWSVPTSCRQAQERIYTLKLPLQNDVYIIKPRDGEAVKRYCDVTSQGGGWTLLVTSKTHTGWTADNVKHRNTNNPSLDEDYSILGSADAIKDADDSQDFFQYRIEGDGYGGIWEAPMFYSFVATGNNQTEIQLVKNFNNINTQSNLATRMPRLGLSADIFLSSADSVADASGSIIFNSGATASPTYLASMPNPSVVRYWVRRGTRRSCNEIKRDGQRAGHSYRDGFYMIKIASDSSQYLPVFCDMTSEPGAFTLLVTSRHNGWTRAQAPARNINYPSLDEDYSILVYGDMIKGLSNNDTFEYKLDAGKKNHNGGVWSAPMSYTFMATNNGQTSVTEVRKFGDWVYSWWKGLNLRMPWLTASGNKSILTTSGSPTYYASGSILWIDDEYSPAYWLRDLNKGNPGKIFYWVNEDDCDADRREVNGGLSEWSAWSACNDGKQSRTKSCTNPKPRCGGRDCSELVSEEQDC